MDNEVEENPQNMSAPNNATIFGRIVDILEETRGHVARTVNSAMVVANWLIGREIVEEEQKNRRDGNVQITVNHCCKTSLDG